VRVLVIGGSGMLGHKVYQRFSGRLDTWVTFREGPARWLDHPLCAKAAPGRLLFGIDVRRMSDVVRALSAAEPAVVINCVGIIKQRPESNDPLPALDVNAVFPHRLADLCAAAGSRLIQVSTDCVFSGKKGGYVETDVADPVDLYGRTKLLGELVRPGCLTLRTSMIGRELAGSRSLLEWFIGQRGRTVPGYVKVVFSGLPTVTFARILLEVIERNPDLAGLYHVAGAPINKRDLLMKVNGALGLATAVESHDQPVCDRSLDASKFARDTGYVAPSWDSMIQDLVNDLTPYEDWRRANAAA
jgi:dTDP-4-dehydrorhamnose reductase